MSKRKYKSNQLGQSKELSLDDIERREHELSILRNSLIEKGLNSTDPIQLLKTHTYLSQSKSSEEEHIKAFLYNPDISSLNINNFRTPIKKVSYETLRKMARSPIIKTVIGTRVDQIAGFSESVTSPQEKGWFIRRKKSLFDKESAELSDEEKRKVEELTSFIRNGGDYNNKWDFDSFEEYLRQMANDSLTVDQICVENVYSRGGQLTQFYPIDAATIRLTDTTNIERVSEYFKKEKGYYPKYVQVWQDQIYASFYPWEMTFGVRNKVTDINANGYGISELEDMVNIVTWLLFGMQYNGNFFSQGSNPKGFFSIEGNLPPNALNDFKQMWRNTIAGISNSHKVPVIETGSSKVNWTSMQNSNKDMEFDNWLEFLIVITCCLYKIDPSECGFNLKKASQVFGQEGQKERLKHSQSKGLTPILKLIQRIATKYWIEPKDKNYEFVFGGIEIEDQSVALDMDVKKSLGGFMSLEDGFKKYSGRDFDPDKDTLLNSVYQQIQNQKMMGGDMMNQQVEGTGQESENPFEKSLVDYLQRI